MKKIAVCLLIAALFILSALPTYAESHLEWDAEAWEDGNYSNYSDFTAEKTVDGGMDTAWQKSAGSMDASGFLTKDCFVALSWENEVEISSLRIWWRSSTRAEASDTGYIVQTGSGVNRASMVWSDADCQYFYETEDQNNGYYVCDEIVFSSPVKTKNIRVLVMRGIDYRDPDRGFSPKINEIEVEGTSSAGEEPVSSAKPQSSAKPESTAKPQSSAKPESTVTPQNTEAPVSSENPVSTPAPASSPSGRMPWLIVIGVSGAVMIASLVILLKK